MLAWPNHLDQLRQLWEDGQDYLQHRLCSKKLGPRKLLRRTFWRDHQELVSPHRCFDICNVNLNLYMYLDVRAVSSAASKWPILTWTTLKIPVLASTSMLRSHMSVLAIVTQNLCQLWTMQRAERTHQGLLIQYSGEVRIWSINKGENWLKLDTD